MIRRVVISVARGVFSVWVVVVAYDAGVTALRWVVSKTTGASPRSVEVLTVNLDQLRYLFNADDDY